MIMHELQREKTWRVYLCEENSHNTHKKTERIRSSTLGWATEAQTHEQNNSPRKELAWQEPVHTHGQDFKISQIWYLGFCRFCWWGLQDCEHGFMVLDELALELSAVHSRPNRQICMLVQCSYGGEGSRFVPVFPNCSGLSCFQSCCFQF